MGNHKLKILVILITISIILSFSIFQPSVNHNSKQSLRPYIVSNEIKYGYVANGNPYINYITVFNRQTMNIVSNITVGIGPIGIVTSPNGSFIYVSNFDSNNVSVINTANNEVVRSINVGISPGSISISPNGNYIVVANSGSSNVSIINTTSFLELNVNVGGSPGGYNGYTTAGYPNIVPDGIVFSPNGSFAYIGNADGNVTAVNVLSGKVLRQITVSIYPVNGLAISNNGQYIYALVDEYVPSMDYGSHLSVISTQTFSIIHNISTDYEPESIVLSKSGNLAYVTSGFNNTVDVLNLTTNNMVNRFYLPNNSYPIGILFSPSYQFLYVADSGNNNISVINVATGSVSTYQIGIYPISISTSDLYPVDFKEYDLHSGTNWSVKVNSINISSNSTQIQFLETNGSYAYSIGMVPGYKPNQNQGDFRVSGNSVLISVLWTQIKYSISFKEFGLPAGTNWSVKLNNTFNSSTSNVINFTEPNGSYSYIIGVVPGFRTQQNNGEIIVKGKNVTQDIYWSVNKYTVSFIEYGLRTGIQWYVTFNGNTSYSKYNTIQFSYPNGSYSYTVGRVNGYIANEYSGNVTLKGKNVTLQINWSPVLYEIYFNETGLPSGSAWSVTLNGTIESSTTSTITFQEPNGSYLYKIGSINGYDVSPSSGTITVNGAIVNQAITFTANSTKTYTITFTETGLPSGSAWSVTLNGLTRTSLSNTITFNESYGTYTYTITLPNGYETSQPSGTITTTQSIMKVLIVISSTSSTSPQTSFSTYSSIMLIGIIAAIIVIIAIVALIVFMRKGKNNKGSNKWEKSPKYNPPKK